MAAEQPAFRPHAHGPEAQEKFLEQLLRVQRPGFLLIVPVGVLDHGVKVGEDGVVLRAEGGEIRIIADPPSAVQPLQHQLYGVDLRLGEVLVCPEEVLEEGDVLAEPAVHPKGLRGIFAFLCVLLNVHVPYLRLQGVDDVLPAGQVQKAAAQVLAQLRHLMLRVQADHGLARLQQIDRQELQQVALSLAGVPQDEDVGVGLVLRPPVQVHNDAAAEAVPPDVEAMGVQLAGVVEGVQVGGGGGGEDPLKLAPEAVLPCRIDGAEALLLPEENAVNADPGPDQGGHDLVLQGPQALLVPGCQLHEHGAVDQGFPAAVDGGDQGLHILQVGLRRDCGLHVAGTPVHPVPVVGVMEDLVFLLGRHLTDVYGEGHAALVPQVPKQSQPLRPGGVSPDGEGCAEGAAQDVSVRIEPNGGGGDDVQEVLGHIPLLPLLRRGPSLPVRLLFLFSGFLLLRPFPGRGRRLRRRYRPFSLLRGGIGQLGGLLRIIIHGEPSLLLRRCSQSIPWSCPAGNTPPAGASRPAPPRPAPGTGSPK